jgi:hypothetical protein
VKKLGFTVILLIITAILLASCGSTAKSQTEVSPAKEIADSVPPEPQVDSAGLPEPEYLAEEQEDTAIPEETSDTLAGVAEGADIEELPVEDEAPMLAQPYTEPEPQVGSPEPEPLVIPELKPEPPPITVSPPIVSAPAPVSPPPPEPQAGSPPRVTPPPPPQPTAPPPVVREPPAIVQEPPPPPIPELPNPTPAITGLQEEEMVFSRTVRATLGQLVVVPFRGTGWVYLGEVSAQRGIVYDSRRLDPEGQNFVFRTEAAGDYALKFYRQDFIRDFILNDYVKVIVGPPTESAGTGWFNPSVDRGRVIAEPRWPTSLAEAQALRADTRPSALDTPLPVDQTDTANPPSVAVPLQPAAPVPSVTPAPAAPATSPAVPSTPPTIPPNPPPPPVSDPLQSPPDSAVDPESYLEKAKEEFGAGRVASAISILDQLRVYYPIEGDEVLWLYGQFYEANSPSRNILTSLEYYRRLMEEYPQSSRYDDARRRVAYLQRYYINIH